MMTGRNRRSWIYAFSLITLLGLLAILPPFLKKRRYLYTPPEAPVNATVDKLPLDKTFARVMENGTGAQVSLAQLAGGRPGGLLINFWATWCPPCLEELPSLEQLSRQLESRNDPNLPRLVTISVDERIADILNLKKTLSFRPSFSILHDPSGAFSESIGTIRFPETYWVGPDGAVRYKWLGPQDWLSEPVLRRLASP